MIKFLKSVFCKPEHRPIVRTTQNPQPAKLIVSRGMNFDKFRADPNLVSQVSGLYSSQLGQDMIDAVNSRIPQGYPHRGQEISPTNAAVELGRLNGYMDCLQVFKALGVSLEKIEGHLEADFGAGEQPEN